MDYYKQKIEKLESALVSWVEYFEAIKDGEYDGNRRTSPLRSYEEALLLKSEEALGDTNIGASNKWVETAEAIEAYSKE